MKCDFFCPCTCEVLLPEGRFLWSRGLSCRGDWSWQALLCPDPIGFCTTHTPKMRVAAAVCSIACKWDTALGLLVNYHHHRSAGGWIFLSHTYKLLPALHFWFPFTFPQCLRAHFAMCLYSTYHPIFIPEHISFIFDAITL